MATSCSLAPAWADASTSSPTWTSLCPLSDACRYHCAASPKLPTSRTVSTRSHHSLCCSLPCLPCCHFTEADPAPLSLRICQRESGPQARPPRAAALLELIAAVPARRGQRRATHSVRPHHDRACRAWLCRFCLACRGASCPDSPLRRLRLWQPPPLSLTQLAAALGPCACTPRRRETRHLSNEECRLITRLSDGSKGERKQGLEGREAS